MVAAVFVNFFFQFNANTQLKWFLNELHFNHVQCSFGNLRGFLIECREYYYDFYCGNSGEFRRKSADLVENFFFRFITWNRNKSLNRASSAVTTFVFIQRKLLRHVVRVIRFSKLELLGLFLWKMHWKLMFSWFSIKLRKTFCLGTDKTLSVLSVDPIRKKEYEEKKRNKLYIMTQ